MPMPLPEYNRTRPGSASGTNYGANGAGSTWKSSVVGTMKPVAPAQARTSHDTEYDSDDLDFEAYKKNRFPNAVADSAQGRSASALGMSANVEYSSNEALASTANASDNQARSRSGSNPNARPTAGPRRLQNMLQNINARMSTNTSSRSTGLPNGRSTSLRGAPETTNPLPSSISQPDPMAIAAVEAPRPGLTSTPSVSSTTTTTVSSSSSPIDRIGPPRSTSQKEGMPKAPNSDAESDGDVSIDVGSYNNGIAARKYFRVMDARLNVLRDSWRKDPKNAGLSDYDLNQGAKSIQFEDPGEQKLYEELRHYVVRDGKLGSEWEKYCISIGRRVDDDFVFSEEEDDEFKDPLKQSELEDEDSGVQTGKYHDANDYPQIETIDLASFDEPARARSNERASHNRVRSGATTVELALANGPLSAGTSGFGTRPWAPATASSPEGRQLAGPPGPKSGAGTRAPNPPSLPLYQSEYKQTYPTHQPDPLQQLSDEDEESSPPMPGGKFVHVALNDTLQLRQQRTPWSTLPPDAIVYEPPPPPAARSTRNRREQTFESGLTTARVPINATAAGERDRPAPSRASALPASSAKQKQRFNSSQTVHAPPQQQTLAHQQRLTKSAGKRRAEERDYGTNSGAEERRPAGLQRTGSGRALRGEDEGRDSGAEQHGYVGVGFQQQSEYQEPRRGPLPRDQMYQPHTRYPGSHMYPDNDGPPAPFMRVPHPAPVPSAPNGQQYHGAGVNGGYNAQGQDSSPIEPSRQGQNTVTPGVPGDNRLVRANTMPSGGNSVIPAEQQKNLLTINKHQYLRLELIGRGGSSKVFRVIRTKDWKTFAMKKVALSTVDDEAMRSYATEIQMLKRLSGNNSIVRLIDDELRGKGSGTLFLVMELGETDFNRLLYERQGTAISIPWITLYFKQMLEAVNVIHEERIVHSDLKPANFVLIRNTLKLIDFGIAKAIANDTTNIQRDSQIGTLNYMSPETMNAAPGDDRLKIGRPSDVWSLGCILYQMVYGAAPFAAFSLQQKMIAIAREEHQIDYPEYAVPVVPKEKAASGRPELREELRVRVPVEMIATMKACLTREARRRPTIAMLLKEGWLEGLYGNEPSTPPPPPLALAPDEAVISSHYMLQLINYCFRSYDPNWDEDDAENMQRVEEMAAQVMPQLRALRPNE